MGGRGGQKGDNAGEKNAERTGLRSGERRRRGGGALLKRGHKGDSVKNGEMGFHFG